MIISVAKLSGFPLLLKIFSIGSIPLDILALYLVNREVENVISVYNYNCSLKSAEYVLLSTSSAVLCFQRLIIEVCFKCLNFINVLFVNIKEQGNLLPTHQLFTVTHQTWVLATWEKMITHFIK